MEVELYSVIALGVAVSGRQVVALGDQIFVRDTTITVARFSDGAWGIVTSGDRCPDLLPIGLGVVSETIAKAISPPTLHYDSAAGDWFQVHGVDRHGRFTARIYLGRSGERYDNELARS
jgi:hypothetical protein